MRGAKKAVVLAAGLGTRLRPLTCAAPKPLLPVWGEPMLGRVVAFLRSVGVEDIVVNCHYLHGQVERWAADNGCRTSFEPEILGTGGALNPLREWIGADDFYLVNGDIVFEGFEGFSDAGGADASVIGRCLLSESGPRTVEADPSGLVTCWNSPDPGFPGTFTYCGVALLKADVLKYVEPAGASSIVQAYERAMADGRFVRGETPGELLWTDAGTVDSYAAVNSDGEENGFPFLPQVAASLEALGADSAGERVEFAGARGSDRCFFTIGPKASPRAVAVVYDDSKRGENARYAAHARFLRGRGMPVPAVLADFPELKTTLFEWAGTPVHDLSHAVKTVEALASFGALAPECEGAVSLEPAFGPAIWRWERELFAERFLGDLCAVECPRQVVAELEGVARRLDAEPPALVHRDFQSSNVLWRGGDLFFIDFQGMRIGPAAYDLASFVFDPYVSFSDGEVAALVKLYAKAAGRPDIAEALPFAAVQRLVQCLGAYGRLAGVGHPEFLHSVPVALARLGACAVKAGLPATAELASSLAPRFGHGHHDCGCGHDHGHHGCGCGHDHGEAH